MTLLFESGPMAFAALLLGLIGVPFAVFTTWAVGFMGWRLPASLGWIPSTLAVLLGLFGVLMGSSSAMHAAIAASPEMRSTMIAQGIAEAMGASQIAAASASMGFLAAAFAGCLPAMFVVGPDARFNLSSTLGSVAGAIVGGLGASIAIFSVLGLDGLRDMGIGLFLMPPIAMMLTLGIVLSSLRESDEREHQGRIAGSRMAILTASVLGIVLMGEAMRLYGVQQAFMAVAFASAETKASLMAYGLAVAAHSSKFALCLCLMPLGAGIGGVMGVLGRADSREFMGAALAGVQIMVIILSIVVGSARFQGALDLLMAG